MPSSTGASFPHALTGGSTPDPGNTKRVFGNEEIPSIA